MKNQKPGMLSKLTKIEFKVWLRGKENTFFAIVLPLLLFLLSAYAFPPLPGHSRGYTISWMSSGGISLVLLVSSFTCLSMTIVEYKENRYLRRFATTPLSPSKFLLIELLVSFLFTLVALCVFFAVVFSAGMRVRGASPLLLIPPILLGWLTYSSFALMVAGLVKNSKTAYIIVIPFMMLILFVSNFFMDISYFPDAFQPVSEALLGTPLCTLLRKIILGSRFLPGEITKYTLTLIGWLVGTSLITLKTFRWE